MELNVAVGVSGTTLERWRETLLILMTQQKHKQTTLHLYSVLKLASEVKNVISFSCISPVLHRDEHSWSPISPDWEISNTM